MPLYSYRCKECGEVEESFRPVRERDDFPSHCDQDMVRSFHPARFNMPKLTFDRQLNENRKYAEVYDEEYGQKFDWDTGRARVTG